MPADLFLQPIFVTGASGFIGKALIRKLTDDGYPVTALLRLQNSAMRSHCDQPDIYGDGIQSVSANSCMVHLAARVHVMSDEADDPLLEFRAANVNLTLNLARQAAAAGVRRFIFLSSIKVNGEETQPGHAFSANDDCAPQDSYAVSKMEAEQGLRKIAAETGLEVVIVRPPLVYGPGVRANFAALMRAVERGLPLPLGCIDNRRSLIALDNLLDFIAACIKYPGAAGQTFVVSDGDDLSTPELIRRIARALGRPARLIPVPVWMLRAGAALLGKQQKLQRLYGNLQIDISKTCDLMAWKPPFSVDECLAQTAAAWHP